MADTKKFLDQEGVKHLWSKVNMQDYPNNDVLMAVINAIDTTKMDKNMFFVGTQEEYEIAKTNNEIALGAIIAILESSIQNTETITYYSSLSDALSETNGDTNLTDASTIAVKESEDSKTISLLSNIETTEATNIEEDISLELNDYTITTTATPAIRIKSNVTITANNNGGIVVNAPTAQKGTVLSVMSGELNVDGGTYIANTSAAGTSTNQTQCLYAYTDTTLNVKNATIISIDIDNGCANGVTGLAGSTIILENCDVTTSSGTSLENRGISSKGDITLINCNVNALANYTANSAGTAYAANSRGVWCSGHLIMRDTNVYGAHAGVTVQGTCYINGGIYKGYGHGGIYLAGTSGPHYFYNAEFDWCPMADGTVADTVAGTNGAGFYIGGTSNQIAYFDNCDFNMIDANGETYKNAELPFYGIVMRTSGGEKNNVVYISNSYVQEAKTQMFRGPGSNSMKVYNGIGNDWSKAAVVHKTNSTYFIDTTDSYAEQE